MADEHKVKEDESHLNKTNQNGRPINGIDQLETDYSSDEGISSEDGETCSRTNSFYERAFAESKRMNLCIYEDQDIQAKLREEFGSGIFSEWLQEHSQEILFSTPNDCLQAHGAHHMTKELVGMSDT